MRTGGRVLLAVGTGFLLAAVAALLLLSGNVAAAIWMEGPYFPLTLLLPGSADTLVTMVAVVAAYYFVCSLVALTRSSWRGVIIVVLVVVVVNTLGVLAWHRASVRYARDHQPVAQHASSGRCLSTSVDGACDHPTSVCSGGHCAVTPSAWKGTRDPGACRSSLPALGATIWEVV